MENPLSITCIACGSTPHHYVGEKVGYHLYRCIRCRHMAVSPMPHIAPAVYGEDYFAGAHGGFGYVSYDEDKEPMRRLFHTSLADVEKQLGRVGRMLDVGAATGFLLAIARERGWETTGIEISEFASKRAREKGLDVKEGTLQSVNLDPEWFDLVTMWDVIEHVSNPEAELRCVYSLLKTGGLLYINTPDSGSLWARVLGKHWNAIVPPEHLHYFNRKSLILLLEKLGFEVVAVGAQKKSFTLEYIVHTFARWLSLSPLYKVVYWLHSKPRLGTISIPINLRDNMYILARKR